MTPERLAEIRKRWSNGPNPMDDPPENEISDWLDMRELLDHIAQLEAQRGELARELDLTKREAWTAKERHKDERDRADGLRERLDELSAEEFARAQRGGAVVVPEPTVKQWIKEVLDAAYNDPEPHATMRAAAKWFRENAKAIPADRVLADGMVGMDREAIKTAIGLVRCLVVGPGSGQDALSAMESALRSAKGEVEG